MDINSIKTKDSFHNYVTIKQSDNTSPIEVLLCDSKGTLLSNLNEKCTVSIYDAISREVRQVSDEQIVDGVLSFKIVNDLFPYTHKLEVTTYSGVKFPADDDFQIFVSESHNSKLLNIIKSIPTELALKVVTQQVMDRFNGISNNFINYIKKGEVSVSDININLGKIGLEHLSESVIQAIAGTAPVNAVPANLSITTEKMADNAITKLKRTVGGEFAAVNTNAAVKVPNIDLTNKTFTLFSGTFLSHFKNRVSVSGDKTVNFSSTGGSALIAYDTSTNELSSISAANVLTLNENQVIIALIYFTGTTQSALKSVVMLGDYTVNNSEKFATSLKRTELGDYAIVGTLNKMININLVNNQFEIPKDTFINWRNKRYATTQDLTIKFLAGTSQILVFDTATNTYRSDNGSNYVLIKESEVVIASLYFATATQNKITYAKANFDFTVNGEDYYLKNQFADLKEVNKFASRLAKDEIYSANLQEDVSSTMKSYTHDQIYSMYDEIRLRHSDYFKKTLLGTESTEKELYRYDLKPPYKTGTDVSALKLPKIILTVGTHGSEKTAVWSTLQFVEDLCDNWQSKPELEYLRWHCHLIIVPIVNPSGYDYIAESGVRTGTRKNANGVDLARNFPTGWSLGSDPTAETYGGASPLSEKETQYLDALLKAEKENCIYVCDFHNFFAEGNGIWNAAATNFSANISESLIRTLSYKWKSELDFMPKDETTIVGYSDLKAPNGSIAVQAKSYGIHASTFEVAEKLIWENGTINSPAVIKFGTEGIANWLNIILKNGDKLIGMQNRT